MHSTKRGRMDHRLLGRVDTPSKPIQFFSSPRCPPSPHPHHKPRASSPLRKPTESPIVVIKRPACRQPLGKLEVVLQGQGSPARQTSKDFELYEDTSPLRERVKSSPTKLSPIKFSPYKFSPMKIDDKENDDPFPWHKTEMGDDPFVRPLPRGPLNKLRRSGQGDTEAESIVGKKTMMEEITTESFAGGNITRETTV